MINFKICLVGACAVGKTSLTKQFVYSIFSDQYLSTIGVKISKKDIKARDENIKMIIWDMEGKSELQTINTAYLAGASGFFIVVDSTRKETLLDGIKLKAIVDEYIGIKPYYFLINKVDLESQCELDEESYKLLEENNIKFIKTSAKSGLGVEEAFFKLAEDLLDKMQTN